MTDAVEFARCGQCGALTFLGATMFCDACWTERTGERHLSAPFLASGGMLYRDGLRYVVSERALKSAWKDAWADAWAAEKAEPKKIEPEPERLIGMDEEE